MVGGWLVVVDGGECELAESSRVAAVTEPSWLSIGIGIDDPKFHSFVCWFACFLRLTEPAFPPSSAFPIPAVCPLARVKEKNRGRKKKKRKKKEESESVSALDYVT